MPSGLTVPFQRSTETLPPSVSHPEEPLMKQTYTPPVLESLSLRATQDIELDLDIIIGIGS